jgi:peroxiredoxin Q/BCP
MRHLSFLLFVALMIGVTCSAVSAGELLKAGDEAPSFEAKDDTGKDWKSTDHVGNKIVVVYFYPADMTGGCTKQACSFRDDKPAWKELGVEVVGVSGDSVENHQLFKQAENLNFALLADPEGEIAKKFGVPTTLGEKSIVRTIGGQEKTLTRGATTQRYTFVIDTDGKIAAAYKVADAAGDSRVVMEIVKKLK